MNLLPLGLESLELVSEKENARFALAGIHLTVKPDNTFVAQSTNGRVAIRVTGDCLANDPENPYPAIPSLDSAPNGECVSIIPRKEWKEAFASAKKIKAVRPIMRSVAVTIGKEVTTLASTNENTLNFNQPKNIEGRFPNVEAVLRKPEEAFATCRLSPSVVIEAFTALGKLNGDSPVNVDFYRTASDKPISFIGFRCDSPAGKIDGALMPLGPA